MLGAKRYVLRKRRVKAMNLGDIERKLKDNKTYIKRVFYVRDIGIFGSFIREEQTENSDIDIFVEFEKGHKDFFNYMR